MPTDFNTILVDPNPVSGNRFSAFFINSAATPNNAIPGNP